VTSAASNLEERAWHRTSGARHVLSIVGALALVGPCWALDPEWSQFRGPRGQGVMRTEGALPSKLDPEVNLAWSTAVPNGHSSPCLVGDAVIVTGVEGSELVTLCFARADGALRWRRGIAAQALEKHHEVNSPASSTPASDGERIYVYFGSFGLVAYDLAGAEVWRRALPVPKNTFGSAASPILVDKKLVFVHDTNDDSWLEALDPKTGATVWRRPRPGFQSGWSTPTVWEREGTQELLVYGHWWLTAYDLADGSERWSLPGLTDEPIVTPVVGGGLVYVTSYNMNGSTEVMGLPEFAKLLEEIDKDGDGRVSPTEAAENKSVLSRNEDDGDGDHPLRIFFRFLDVDRDGFIEAEEWPKLVRWLEDMRHANGILAVEPPSKEARDATDEHRAEARVAWQFPRGVPECPSPLYSAGRLFVIKNGGIVSCFDAASGKLHFQERTELRGPVYASLVAGDGKLYCTSARGVIAVLQLGAKFSVLSTNDLSEHFGGQRVLATPALAPGAVYVRSEGRLTCFRA
jgi:outer membrane protein assembly factor BamB